MASATNGKHYDGGGKGGESYKRFSDEPWRDPDLPASVATDTYVFSGSAEAQRNFFRNNSNAEELINEIELDPVKSVAFERWAEGRFMYGQQYDGWDNMWELDKERTQAYDDVLDKSVLKAGVEVRRQSSAELVLGKGKQTATLSELQAMKGRTVVSKGNMSTSVASQGLNIGQAKAVEYVIKIPKGSTGAGAWIGDSRINRWGGDQREFMMNRDTVFKVGNTKYDASRKIFVTELKYVGRTAHDYGDSGRV